MNWGEAKERLESYRSLKADWDSYGADPILPGAIRRAYEVLDLLRAAGYSCPDTMPTNVGGICLDWRDWEIKIEVDEGIEIEKGTSCT